MFGGIEAGGTKFVCAVGTGPDDITAETRFPTTTPQETIQQAIDFFKAQERPVTAVGIGAFGPIDPNPKSDTYGYITTTPKPGWRHTNFANTIQAALNVPVGFDTDVNVAALGEHRWGAAQGLDTFIYLTVGTGIGGGGLLGNQPMHGLIHPEMGHMLIRRHPDDTFEGWCPFHKDCLEGMAAGPALERRWGQPGHTLPNDHQGWEFEAHYLAHALTGFICTLSPQRIILGGGVMAQHHLFPMIRQKVQTLLNGYVDSPTILEHIDQYIVPPGLDARAGVLGAIALAERVS